MQSLSKIESDVPHRASGHATLSLFNAFARKCVNWFIPLLPCMVDVKLVVANIRIQFAGRCVIPERIGQLTASEHSAVSSSQSCRRQNISADTSSMHAWCPSAHCMSYRQSSPPALGNHTINDNVDYCCGTGNRLFK